MEYLPVKKSGVGPIISLKPPNPTHPRIFFIFSSYAPAYNLSLTPFVFNNYVVCFMHATIVSSSAIPGEQQSPSVGSVISASHRSMTSSLCSYYRRSATSFCLLPPLFACHWTSVTPSKYDLFSVFPRPSGSPPYT